MLGSGIVLAEDAAGNVAASTAGILDARLLTRLSTFAAPVAAGALTASAGGGRAVSPRGAPGPFQQAPARGRHVDPAIARLDVRLCFIQQAVELQPSLVALVLCYAHHHQLTLAVLGDEDRLTRVVAELFDLRSVIPQIRDGANDRHIRIMIWPPAASLLQGQQFEAILSS
jgi:hypothetical protein